MKYVLDNPQKFSVEEELKDYKINLFVNTTNSNLVLPKCGWYEIMELD